MADVDGAGKIKFVLMKEHPLMGYALSFMIGVFAAFNFNIPTIAPYLLLAVLIISISAFIILRKRSWYFVLLAFLAMGYLSCESHIPGWYKEDYIPPEACQISGIVEDVNATGYSYEYILSDVTIGGTETISKIKISNITSRDYVDAGDKVRLKAELEKPAAAQIEGMFSERRYYMTKDIQYLGTIFDTRVTILKHGEDDSITNNLQGKIFKQLNDDFSNPVLGVLFSLSTGSKDYLDDDFYTKCQELGIAHIFAISGLHIGALLLLWELYCQKRKKRFLIKILGSTALIIVLYLVVGSRASLLRAIAMWALVIVYQYTGRKGDVVDFLAIAMLFLLIINPLYVIDVGFLLSVTCVGAIALVYVPISKIKKSEQANKLFNFYPVSLFLLSLSILSISWIVTAKVFGQVAVLSPVWNMFFVPLAMLLIALLMLYALTFYIPFISIGAAWLVDKVASFIIYLVKLFSSVNIDINMPEINLIWAIGIIAVLLLMTNLIIKGRNKLRLALGMIFIGIIMSLIIFISPSNRLEVFAGYDNSFVYIVENDKSMVIINTDDGGIERVLEDIDEEQVDMLLYTGNDIYDLEELLLDVEDISFGEIIVHKDLLEEYIGAGGYTGVDSDETIIFGETEIYLARFSANKNAIIHYYADIKYDDRHFVYLDPQRLREGAIKDCEILICSRWTKQRIENLIYANPQYVIINSRDYLMDDAPVSQNHMTIPTFNINNNGSFTYFFEGEK